MKTVQQRLEAAMSLTSLERAAEVYNDTAVSELNTLQTRLAALEAQNAALERHNKILREMLTKALASMHPDHAKEARALLEAK